ncbi:hypothetical protein RDI58_025828 [Solanum bulbocastanum]|uniref:Uncharacterized protein n=1 Tax=Solanum bulbocastanum TaxID=147425 RepID=A0AAN8Y485_SOLBU
MTYHNTASAESRAMGYKTKKQKETRNRDSSKPARLRPLLFVSLNASSVFRSIVATIKRRSEGTNRMGSEIPMWLFDFCSLLYANLIQCEGCSTQGKLIL